MQAQANEALLCVDGRILMEKPSKDNPNDVKLIRAIKATIHQRKMSVTPEQLAEMVAGEGAGSQTFCPAEMASADETGWQSQRVIVADVDNETHERRKREDGKFEDVVIPAKNPVSPDAALAALKAAGIGYSFAYYSFSHSDALPKFRIVFWLDETLTGDKGKERVRAYGRRINAILDGLAGEPVADPCNQKPAQMFFGGRGLVSAPFEITRCSSLDSLPEPVVQQAETPAKTAQAASTLGEELTRLALSEDLAAFVVEHFPESKQDKDRFNPCPICGSESGFSVKGAFWVCHSTRHDLPEWMREHVKPDGQKVVQSEPGGTVIDLIRQKGDLSQGEALDAYRSIKGIAAPAVVPEKKEAPNPDKIVDDLRAAGYDLIGDGWTFNQHYADRAQVRKFVRDRFFAGHFPRGQTKEIMQAVEDSFIVLHAEDALPVVCGADVDTSKKTEFLFKPIVPLGCLTSLQGDAGIGKSTILYAMAARVTTGKPLLETKERDTQLTICPCGKSGAVLIITAEDSQESITRSFEDAGGDKSKLFIIEKESGLTSIVDPRIERTVREHGVVLVIIDPLQQFITGDLNSATDTRRQTAPLAAMARELDVAVMLVRHLNKQTGASFGDRASGSGDIRAVVRSALHVAPDPRQGEDSDLLMFHEKSNDAKRGDTLRFRLIGEDGYKAHALLIASEHYTEADWRRDSRAASMAGEAAENPFVQIVKQIASENEGEVLVWNDWYRATCAEMGRGGNERITTLIDRFAAVLFKEGLIVEPLTTRMFSKPFKYGGVEVKPEQYKQRGFSVRRKQAKRFGMAGAQMSITE